MQSSFGKPDRPTLAATTTHGPELSHRPVAPTDDHDLAALSGGEKP